MDSGQWLLYRYDPRRAEAGENPLQLDSAAAKAKVQDYLLSENRFKMLTKSKPEDAKKFFAQAQTDAERRWKFYQFMAARDAETVAPTQPAAMTAPSQQRPSRSNRTDESNVVIHLESTNRIMDLTTTYLGLKLRTPLVRRRLAAVGGN